MLNTAGFAMLTLLSHGMDHSTHPCRPLRWWAGVQMGSEKAWIHELADGCTCLAQTSDYWSSDELLAVLMNFATASIAKQSSRFSRYSCQSARWPVTHPRQSKQSGWNCNDWKASQQTVCKCRHFTENRLLWFVLDKLALSGCSQSLAIPSHLRLSLQAILLKPCLIFISAPNASNTAVCPYSRSSNLLR